MKGIVSQSVKEVLQSLVDDGLVQTDKVGSSNFFWSFPSERGAIMQNRLDTAKETQVTNQKQLEEIKTSIEVEKSARNDTPERAAALDKLATVKKQISDLETELQAYGACDPAKVDEKKRAVTLAKEAAFRWTDNYSILFQHFTRQSMVEGDDIRKYLEIGEDYEDIC
ncbi:meiotic nuclear division protein 1 [Stereum hirsutum FP-91666 SS1]|uniref:meiotic nuclear division protein 1 n=1 Tax=Stereum hirsutum (strain FP-91666) TaxID=721885 RepID=UPI000444A122|nr:meiotic nuclear division protein 1 [Stereum hirsutum FP-91666 SS1]EIM82909.1 meiotic nuclear division protein 1 [Stereum hirsutum FP-91666 SS1]